MSGSSSILYASFKTAFRSAFHHAREQRSSGFKTCERTLHKRCEESLNPSKLDFEPRLKFHSRAKQPSKHSSHCAPPHPTEPCPHGVRERVRLHFPQVWLADKLRHRPHGCAIHGRAQETYAAGGNGGGSFRLQFDHARKSDDARRGQSSFGGRGKMAKTVACSSFSISRHLAGKYAPAAASASASGAEAATHATPPSQHRHALTRPTLSSRSSRSPAPPRCDTRLYTPGLYTSAPKLVPPLFPQYQPGGDLGFARLLHSTPRQQGYLHIAHAAIRAATLLKSAEALTYINLLFRLSVSLLPITIKRAVMSRKAALASLAAGGAGGTVSVSLGARLFKIISRLGLALPFILLAAVLLASLERTPITGRWRLLLLNDKEEQEIVQKVLEAGVSDQASADLSAGSQSRDWLAIMRAVLGEEASPAGTLLGGKVLDSRDWRAQLVESVLSKLEGSIPLLAIPPEDYASSMPFTVALQPPPLQYPLAKHTRTSHLQRKNSVIVIDRPESNAFSFGFFGCVDEPEPGVIIVFTGAIDEIMQGGQKDQLHGMLDHGKIAGTEQSVRKYGGSAEADQMQIVLGPQEPSWLKAFISSLVPASGSASNRQSQKTELAARQVAVSREQEEALAVLLAHELAHLVLSHTIESYASTTLLWPQLEKLGWDMIRVVIYPITAILGPFVQDAISATVKVGIEESNGILPALTSSCESRKLEHEADIVALRLLANAGIDPRSSLDFWEDRLSKEAPLSNQTQEGASYLHGNHAHAHSDHATSSFVKTHPADGDRVAVIRKELARWQRR